MRCLVKHRRTLQFTLKLLAISSFTCTLVIFAILDTSTGFFAHLLIFWFALWLAVVPLEIVLERAAHKFVMQKAYEKTGWLVFLDVGRINEEVKIKRSLSSTSSIRRKRHNSLVDEDDRDDEVVDVQLVVGRFEKSQILMLLIWTLVMAALWKVVGLLRLFCCFFFAVSLFRVFWPLILPGSLLVAGIAIVIILSIFGLLQPWISALISFILLMCFCSMFYSTRRESTCKVKDESLEMQEKSFVKKEEPGKSSGKRAIDSVGLGLLLAPCILLLSMISYYWITVSMNTFWMHPYGLTRIFPMNHLNHNIVLDAIEISSFSEVQQNLSSFKFPLWIKSNYCSNRMENCSSLECIQNFMKETPEESSWIIQRFEEGQEVSVFYFRFPYSKKGKIKSISLKRFDAYENADYLINEELVAHFDSVADSIPGFNAGIFDCVMQSNLKDSFIQQITSIPSECMDELRDESWRKKFRLARTCALQYWIAASSIMIGKSHLTAFVEKMPEFIKKCGKCGQKNLFNNPQ